MLANLMQSSALTETAARMDNVQTTRNVESVKIIPPALLHLVPPSVTVNPVLVQEPVVEDPVITPVVDVSNTPKHSGTHIGTHSDIHTGIDADTDTGIGINTDTSTDTGTKTDTHTGLHTSTDIGIDTGIDVGILSGIDDDIYAGLDAYTDKHTSISLPHNAGIVTDTDTGTHVGIDAGTLIDIHDGRQSGIDIGMPIDTYNDMDTSIDTGAVLYSHIDPELFYPFTSGQGKVLLYLIDAGGKANRNCISIQTGVPISSLAKTLSLLEKKGFIKRGEQKHYEHRERGFFYSIDRQMCGDFYERVRGTQLGIHTGLHAGIRTSLHTGPQHNMHTNINTGSHARPQVGTRNGIHAGSVSPFSSRSLEDLKPTTTQAEFGILKDPELRFWTSEGVTEKQVQSWMAEFDLTQDEITISLRYGRFDILERGDVQNAANWFYKILSRNGFYPKPANYKSLIEIKAEAMRQQQEQDRAARQKLEEAEQENRFQVFVSDPTSSLYQELLSKVGGFAKEQLADGDAMAANIELRELYVQYLKANKG